MSDQRLRELERKWRQTQAIADEAAYLSERVRAGDLTAERLALASYCGHEAARFALGLKDESARARTLGETLRDVARLGGLYAAVRGVWEILSSDTAWRESAHAQAAMNAVTAWVVCPCDEHQAQAGQTADVVCLEANVSPQSWPSMFATFRMVEAVAEPRLPVALERLDEALDDIERAISEPFRFQPPSADPEHFSKTERLSALVDLVRTRLRDWALLASRPKGELGG